MAMSGTSVDDLVAVMEKEAVLALTDDDLHDMLATSSNGLIALLCGPVKVS